MTSEEPDITLINVKLRLGTITLYTEKVYIDLQSPVSVLKNKMCEKDNTLIKGKFEIVYCGNVMEDRYPISMYDVFNGATVHLFKRTKKEPNPEPPKDIDTSSAGLANLGVDIRSLSLNFSYQCALMEISKAKIVYDLINSTPGLSEDPIAITLLQHPDLLTNLKDVALVKRIAETHPSLALAAIQMSINNLKQLVQNHLASMSAGSDHNMEDSDDSSSQSDPNSQPSNRNLSYAITTAQLATAIENVMTQQQQPSTSGASTSTANTGNVPVTPNTTQSQPTSSAVDYTHQLGVMRRMGLYNEPLNLEGLRLRGGSLDTAIELVLSGFDIVDTDNSHPGV